MFDERVNRDAIEATIKDDIKALEKIAESLQGRISFYLQSEKG